ncbi:MAG: DNA mismatch repair protein MutS [Smithella sp.]
MGVGATLNLTPAMKQYVEIKEKYPDCILLYRMGDFYELFFEDATLVAPILEITLTSRNKGKEDSVPLCGFPYHAASSYVTKLVEKGFKVAICEQVEDPKKAKGIVKRDVIRVITPGLLLDAENLSSGENNFLAGLSFSSEMIGLAFVDISTGEFQISEFSDRDSFMNAITGLDCKELIVVKSFPDKVLLKNLEKQWPQGRINYLDEDYFQLERAQNLLNDIFPAEKIVSANIAGRAAVISVAGAVLRYVTETQKIQPQHINEIKWYATENYLIIDDTARRNLELFATIFDNSRAGSLFGLINETLTPMGTRRLRWWLNYPLIDVEKIRARLLSVSEIKEGHIVRSNLRKILSRIYDLERLAGRVALRVANPRDLVALKVSLEVIPELKALMAEFTAPALTHIRQSLTGVPVVVDIVARAIADDPQQNIQEGGFIRTGFDDELDKLKSISTDAKKWIAALELQERQKTGINTLKVGFNNVFGYYIEVTKANAAMVPDSYVRKQTLVNAERYINQELKEFEQTVLNAEEKIREREYELYVNVRNEIAQYINDIQNDSSLIADLDAFVALAEVAEKYHYTCPDVDDEDEIIINDGRHPVVEAVLKGDSFVPNDSLLDLTGNRLLIITGPNMAGKSTYIRQVALVVLLAQMGGFVPAAKAKIGVVDKIFTRVGASDNLARGQSTFMVEMTEVAEILKNATPRSLVILDEVGRGTSTFDGLSIAWAVAEYIHDFKARGVRTLFATHYHQLTDMAATREGAKNYNIAVKEWKDKIIFLRKIMKGGTSRSYGIEVARIAGVPQEVILRAREILHNLEKGEFDEIGMPRIARGLNVAKNDNPQLNLFMESEDEVISELKNLNISAITPLDALNKLHELKSKL